VTTYNNDAKMPALRKNIDELDVLINAYSVAGDKEFVDQLEKLRENLEAMLEDVLKNSTGADETIMAIVDSLDRDSKETE
jgi:hypothetical protein